MRRTTTGLWAGRAWHMLYCAQQGWYSPDSEQLEWGQLRNQCCICRAPSGLMTQWIGPGYLKPRGTPHSYQEMSSLLYKPVKVLDHYICGTCRVAYAPRMRFYAYWDYRTDNEDRRRCRCIWTGTRLGKCLPCTNALAVGRMIRVASADGWQVSRYVDSIDAPLPSMPNPCDSRRNHHRCQTHHVKTARCFNHLQMKQEKVTKHQGDPLLHLSHNCYPTILIM